MNWRLLRGIKEQLSALRKGVHELVPEELLRSTCLEAHELHLLLSGVGEIDVDDWRQHTRYKHCTAQHLLVEWFWRCVEQFDAAQRASLLQFVTGCSRVPLEGFRALQGTAFVRQGAAGARRSRSAAPALLRGSATPALLANSPSGALGRHSPTAPGRHSPTGLRRHSPTALGRHSPQGAAGPGQPGSGVERSGAMGVDADVPLALATDGALQEDEGDNAAISERWNAGPESDEGIWPNGDQSAPVSRPVAHIVPRWFCIQILQDASTDQLPTAHTWYDHTIL